MPICDMPLGELKKYLGTNPCPNDFNAYWDKSLEELDRTESKIELIPSKFQVPFGECFDLYFTGTKNARIHAKYLRPNKANEPHPAILQFHGYSGNSGDWYDKLAYVANGYSVAALDCRGQGGFSEDVGGTKGNTFHGHIIRGLDSQGDNLLFRDIFLDTVKLARIVMQMPEVDENRVGTMGCSQGGGLSLACASLEPRIKKCATIYPFLSDYKRVWEMDLAKGAYQELLEYFRLFDPLHEKEEKIFNVLGYIDVQFLAKRIQGDVLFTTGLMDTTCPPSTQFAIYNRLNCHKEMIIYPDYAHEFLPELQDKIFTFMAGL